MRVISGTARGRRLETLPGEDVTRPTLERVKEAMFSSVQFMLPGANVLDLFAGSGQLGIEALSRGAAKCTFLDLSRAAVGVITANCKTAAVFDRSRVSMGDAFEFLAAAKENFDLVVLDPPFGNDTLNAVLTPLSDRVAQNGVVLCESEPAAQLPAQAGLLRQTKQYRYGKIMVTRYEKEEQA